jgi:hypothetical protein
MFKIYVLDRHQKDESSEQVVDVPDASSDLRIYPKDLVYKPTVAIAKKSTHFTLKCPAMSIVCESGLWNNLPHDTSDGYTCKRHSKPPLGLERTSYAQLSG